MRKADYGGMKNRQTWLALSVLLIFPACASAPLPREQREIKFIEQTTLKQRDAYTRTLTYLAKNLGDSNFAIKVRDPESGTIVTPLVLSGCEGALIGSTSIRYNLEVSTKDNKVRLIYEPAAIWAEIASDTKLDITNEKQLSSARACAESHKTTLIRSLESDAARDSDW